MSAVNQKAVEFIERWKGIGDEKQHSQKFWIDLFQSVLNVKEPTEMLNFEERVKLGHTSYIDIFIPQTKVIVEQKGKDIDLLKKAKQSDGEELTPFEQARRYNISLPHSQKARWIVACNFQTFLIYDMENDPNGSEPLRIELEELGTRYGELRFLSEYRDEKIIHEQQLSIRAGELIGQIYDLLKPQYQHPDSDNTLKSLNKLCVRLVFCLYAEDAGLFDREDNHIFGNYLKKSEVRDLRRRLIDLFEVLSKDPEKNERNPYIDEELARFPYVNGNLFKYESPETEEIPNLTEEIKKLLIDECSEGFDWADISPTIFGSLFESTLNPETRRSGGMHYTSVENIHKVIDPLFLDELKAEFDDIKSRKITKVIQQKCDVFQEKLASLKFLDPACGSGNFLTETYICLRRLENEVIKFKYKGMSLLGFEELNPVKISISQFYGIEINDFAVAVATTALWIAESQMLHETESIIQRNIDFLPLKSNSNIHVGNALRMDWEQIIPKNDLNYIMGNPPFLGYKLQSEKQKEDLALLYESKNLDYVAGWYMKSAEYINKTYIKVSFVSTNSLCQGEQILSVWKELYSKFNIEINFAYRTFIWDSETKKKAHVHCVIVGFSTYKEEKNKFIFTEQGSRKLVTTISPYLIESEPFYIDKRARPINKNIHEMIYGSEPREGGFLILSKEEKEELIRETPESEHIIKRFMSADDFLNNKIRYCLWFKNASTAIIKKSKIIENRIKACRVFREKSKQKQAHEMADFPYLFTSERQPTTDYLLVPIVSSENRKYIPLGYMSPEIIVSNACFTVPNATLYEFGIITSTIHMAWMRTVAGRLKSDYRYSNTIVYNNFIWPEVTSQQKEQISKTAQAILEARALYPDRSLADLYDPLAMPPELLKAHKANDKAVLALYGFKPDATEEEIVAKLMQMYAEKVKQ